MKKVVVLFFSVSAFFFMTNFPLFARDVYQIKAETRDALDAVNKSKREIQLVQDSINVQKTRIEKLNLQLNDMNKELEAMNAKLAEKESKYQNAEERLNQLTEELNSAWDNKKMDN